MIKWRRCWCLPCKCFPGRWHRIGMKLDICSHLFLDQEIRLHEKKTDRMCPLSSLSKIANVAETKGQRIEKIYYSIYICMNILYDIWHTYPLPFYEYIFFGLRNPSFPPRPTSRSHRPPKQLSIPNRRSSATHREGHTAQEGARLSRASPFFGR